MTSRLVILAACSVFVLRLATSQDPCEELPCTFDRDDKPLLCQWTADSSDSGTWVNGESVKKDKFNHLTGIWHDADKRNVNMTRGHAQVASNLMAGDRSAEIVLSSPPFEIIGDTFLYFKYWLASFNAELRLCVDDAACDCPSDDCLFYTTFDSSTDYETDDGPLRKWRPCVKDGRDWDCSLEHKQQVELPAGLHSLHFVASGMHAFATVGVDSIHVDSAGETCGLSESGQTPIDDCFTTRAEEVTFVGIVDEAAVFDTHWDGSVDGCKLFCAARESCRSVVAYAWHEPPECIAYTSSCSDEPDKCLPAEAGADVGEYFERCV